MAESQRGGGGQALSGSREAVGGGEADGSDSARPRSGKKVALILGRGHFYVSDGVSLQVPPLQKVLADVL